MTRNALLIISFSHIVDDARVLKQVRAFSDAFDVTTCGFGAAPAGVVDHIEVGVDRVQPLHGLAQHLLPRIDALMSRVRNFRWTYDRIPYVREARRRLKGRTFDAVIANDVDTVPVALGLGAPVHADLHEFFPGLHDDSSELGRRQTAYYTWLVRRFASHVSSSTTVSQGIAEAYRRYGLEPGVVTNATPRALLAAGPVGSPIRLVHSGNAQPSRQLEIIMRAAAATTANVTLDLLLMPNDVAYLHTLRDLADRLGSRVRVLDPVPQSHLVATLNEYDLGVHVLPASSFNNANALPNKFFDYVQARLGLLIGPSPEMVRVLTEYDLGTVASAFSVESVQAEMDRLDPDRVATWKQASDVASDALSADSQIAVWKAAISRLR